MRINVRTSRNSPAPTISQPDEAPYKSFSGIIKYPSMMEFRRNIIKINNKIKIKKQDDACLKEKNYFSKNAVPYINHD